LASIPTPADAGLAWDEIPRPNARDRERWLALMSFKRIGNLRLAAIHALVRTGAPCPSRPIIANRA
jgi:hypothetical protein